MTKSTVRNTRGAAYDKAMIDSGKRVIREAAAEGRALVGWKDGKLIVERPGGQRKQKSRTAPRSSKAAK